MKQGNFTARYLQDVLGVKAWIIHRDCVPVDNRTMPDGRIVALFDIEDVRALKRSLMERKAAERRSRAMMRDEGRQLCRKCGAIIPWPGTPYCNTLECLPPSLAARRK